MFVASQLLQGLGIAAAAAAIVWLMSVARHDVSIVDSLWPILFLLLSLSYGFGAVWFGPRPILLAVLVGVWALRLAVYITWRNWGHGEDRRYQAIRARNEPYFAIKSLFLVFLLQAVLATVVSLPLLGGACNLGPLGICDVLGTALWAVGVFFEAGGDWQLARFKSSAANKGKVMDRGLWRLTRHPNYFGEFCIWWGFYIIAAGAGAWWSVIGPLLMSFLLLRVSGVTLLEKDIGERRPQYADYVRRTNAFFPGAPKEPPG